MRKLLFTIMIAITPFFQINGQQPGNEVYDFIRSKPALSPEASGFARYGQIPVGHYTGTPSVSIPFYTIDVGSLQIPINLSYHASGIKVDDVASWVGLGWVLNAGGCITRQVNDLPDEVRYLPPPPFPRGTNLNYVDSGTARLIWDLVYNEPAGRFADKHFDEYYVNLPDNSFSFIMRDSHPTKLQKEGMLYSINGMKVRMTDGDEPKFVLVKDGYVYEFEEIEYCEYNNQTYTIENRTSGLDAWYKSSDSDLWQTAVVSTWYLTSVTTPENKKIQFKYKKVGAAESIKIGFNEAFGPQYLSHDHLQPHQKVYRNAIQSTTRTLEQVYLSEIHFDGGYVVFKSSAERLDNTAGLRLDTIGVYDKSGNPIKTATFNYDYFTNDQYPNRFTSGKEEFKHRLKLLSVTINDEIYSFEYNNTLLPVRHSFSIDWEGYYNGSGYNSIPLPLSKFGDEQIGQHGVSREPNLEKMQACILKTIHYPTQGYTNFEYENHKAKRRDVVCDLGGLRIKTIKSYNNNGDFLEGKEYKYGVNRDGCGIENIFCNYNNPLSYMFTFAWGVYKVNPTDVAVSVESTSMHRYGDYIIRSPYKNHISYPHVYEYDIDQSGNSLGYTYYNYSHVPNVVEQTGTEVRFKNTSIYDNNLLLTEVYDNVNNLKFRKRLIYTYVVKDILYSFNMSMGSANYVPMPSPTYSPMVLFSEYKWIPHESVFVQLSSIEETTYTSGGNMTNTTEYAYDSGHPIKTIQPYKQTVYSSDGGKIVTDYTYVMPENESAATRDYLLSINYRPLKEEKITKTIGSTNTILSQKKYNYSYDVIRGEKKYNLSSIQEKENNTNNYKTVASIQYNRLNNPTHISFLDGEVDYVWGYNGKYIIAEIKNNVNPSDVAHTSFEDDCLTNNWGIGSSERETTFFKNGQKSYNLLNASRIIKKDGLVPGKTYILSYWGRNGSINIGNCTLNSTKTVTTYDGWTFYEHTITINNNVPEIILSGNNSDKIIDDLSLYPVEATITTYTYKPLVGMTSSTDPNGVTTYYEYDNFGRLERTLIGEINSSGTEVKRELQKHDYHYKNQ